MEKTWRVGNRADLDYQKKFPNLNRIILDILFNRKIQLEKIESFLNSNYERDLYDPFLFKDMERVVNKITEIINNKEKICVYGDYDADGVGASAIIVSFLKEIGADIFCYIPDRKNEGNGLNNNAIDFIKSNDAKLIITVDCGIVAFSEVLYIKSLGMDVIISDHHEPMPHRLPEAYAIINAKVEDETYPFKELCGAGVAFKIAYAVALRHEKKDELLKYLKWNLDIVAVSTVADMVSLNDENRTIVKYGLIVINQTRNLGLKQLIRISLGESNENNKKEINSVDIGFKIGPRINAAGRMDHANMAYDLLISKDIEEIKKIANDLNEKNNERQSIVTSAVKNFMKENGEKINDKMIIAHHDSWPVGVLGLIATKIRDFYNLPTFALTTQDNNIVGSGRSVDGFDITKAMQENESLFIKFGGHKMACGCVVSYDKYNEFNDKMKKYAEEVLDVSKIEIFFDIDLEIGFDDIDFDFCDQLKKLEPFGKDNEEPIFYTKNVKVLTSTVFGKNSDHFKMNVSEGDSAFTVIAFSSPELFDKFKLGDVIDLVYKVDVNEWGGRKEIRLMYVDHKKI